MIKKLIKKQIENIQIVIDNFFNKVRDIISFEDFLDVRDSINYDINECIFSWNKFGTGRWSVGFDKETKKITFGMTNTNHDFTHNTIDISSIETSSSYKELREIILNFKHITDIIDPLVEEIEKIKDIIININEFKVPQYKIKIIKEEE